MADIIDTAAKELGLSENKQQEDASGNIVYDLTSDNEFGKLYSRLETLDGVEGSDDYPLLNTHTASLKYVYKDMLDIELRADFDSDIYNVIMKEI